MDGLWTPVIFCAGVKRMYLGHDTGAILVSIQYMMQLLPMHFSWNMYDAFWNTLIDFSWIMYVPWNFFIDFSWNVSCFALWYVFGSIQDDFDVVTRWLMKFDDFWNSDGMFEHWCLKIIKTFTVYMTWYVMVILYELWCNWCRYLNLSTSTWGLVIRDTLTSQSQFWKPQ